MKKWFTWALALMMVLTCIPAAALAEDVRVLKGWGAMTFNDQTGLTSYSEQFTWKEIETRIGIKVEWETVSDADKQTKFSLMMASGEMPDFVVDMDPLTYEEFGRMGAFIPLNDYITPEKMPNLYAHIAAEPEVKASITSADGNIYFLPRILELPGRYWNGTFIRADYLEKVGMEMPDTIDELYEALKAFKEQIPECTTPVMMNMTELKTLLNAWGIGARGVGLTTTDDAYINKDGEIAYAPTEDKYREALTFIHKLYVEGLLSPDWNSLDTAAKRTALINGTGAVCAGSFLGMMTSWNALLSADGKEEVLTFIPPMAGPYGDRAWQGHHTAIDVSYGLAITSACEDIDTMLELIDYTFSMEGRELIYWGAEGVTYNIAEDGSRIFTEDVATSILGTLTYLNNYNCNASTYPTAMLTEQYQFSLSPKAKEGNMAQTEIGSQQDTRMPSLRYTESEIAEVNAICIDLNAYVDEHFSLFVNGDLDIADDAVWQKYVDGFSGLRLEELLGYYGTAYARWLEIAAQ